MSEVRTGYSYYEFLGDGVTDTFTVNFALGNLRESFVTCQVNGEVDGAGNPVYRTLGFVPGDAGQVVVGGDVPGVGERVVFRRVIPKDLLLHLYANGSILDYPSLDDTHLQLMMAVHEILDGFGFANIYTDIDMHGFNIVGVNADRTNPKSVVTFEELQRFSADVQALTILGTSEGASFVGYSDTTVKEHLDALVASGGSALVGFLQDGTGASARTVQAKLRDVVSVKDFGAVGDGVTDDASAIQAALNSGATRVQISGVHIASNTLVVPDGVELVGDGNGYEFGFKTALIFKGAGAKQHSVSGITSISIANPDSGALYLADSGIRGDIYKTLDLEQSFSAAIILGKGSAIRNVGVYPYLSGVDGYAVESGTLSDNWDVGVWCRNADGWLMSGCVVMGHWRLAANLVTAHDISDGKIPSCEHGMAHNCMFQGFRGVALRSEDVSSGENYGFAGTIYSSCVIKSLDHQSNHLATSSALATPFSSPSANLECSGSVMRGVKFADSTFIGRDDVCLFFDDADEIQFDGCYFESKNAKVSGAWLDPAQIGARWIATTKSSPTFNNCTKFGIDQLGAYEREASVTRFSSLTALFNPSTTRETEEDTPSFSASYAFQLQRPQTAFKFWKSGFSSELLNISDAGNLSISGGSITTKSDALNFYRTVSGTPNYVFRVYSTGNTDVNGNFRPYGDNTFTLGGVSSRWSVVYSGTGTINTSDKREKSGVRELLISEQKVAKRLKKMIRAFCFNNAVAEKGENARIHFGLMAQELGEAFAAEGLDPHRYAMFCYDEWPEERGENGDVVVEAGNRYGIRYDELFAFIISAL